MKFTSQLMLADLRRSLAFDEISSREEKIQQSAERAHEDTFDWVLDLEHPGDNSSDPLDTIKASLREWLHGNGTLFWICGKAASGKSTLMRKICHDSRLQYHLRQWAPAGTVTVANMFFTTEGSELQRSQEGLLRSILYQALVEPTLALQVLSPHLFKRPNNRGKLSWTLAELHIAFRYLLSLATKTQRFCLFVDGLDEYNVMATTNSHPPEYYLETDNEQGRRIRSGHRDIAKLLLSASNNGYVKICASSRPSNEIHAIFSQCPTFQLELLTKRDMETFVRAQLVDCGDTVTAAQYEHCAGAIVTNASGVFLWVNLATDILVDGIVNGVPPPQLRDMLYDLPTELGGPKGLYMRILQRLDQAQRAEAWNMFDIVLNSRRDLTPLCLSFAATANPQGAIEMGVKVLSKEEIGSRSAMVQKRLRALGGILEILSGVDRRGPLGAGNHVRFIHLTAEEFLLRADVQRILKANSAITKLDANVVLLSICLMTVKSIAFPSPDSDGSMEFWKPAKDALYYAAHAESTTGLPQTGLLDDLNATIQSICPRDFRHYSRQDKPHWIDHEPQESGGKVYDWNDDFMSLAVEANLTLYLEQKLDNGYRLADKLGRPLLAYAIVPKRVNTLIQYCPGRDHDMLGADFSNASMIRLLLRHHADPNAVYRYEFGGSLEEHQEGSHCWPSHPSIWQLSLASGLRCHGDVSGKLPLATSWLETMKILLTCGLSVTETVWQEHGKRQWVLDQESALFVCLRVSMVNLGCDASLPRLLVSKGGCLRPGEVRKLVVDAHGDLSLLATRYAFLRSFFPNLPLSPENDAESDAESSVLEG
jgi:hypothetical protein